MNSQNRVKHPRSDFMLVGFEVMEYIEMKNQQRVKQPRRDWKLIGLQS